jgi:hypothetical protein
MGRKYVIRNQDQFYFVTSRLLIGNPQLNKKVLARTLRPDGLLFISNNRDLN